MIYNLLFSMSAGILVGYSYGLLFLMGKGVPSLLTQVMLTLVRFVFLVLVGGYLLTVPSLQPIILVLSFLATFWLIILRYKAHFDEKNRNSTHT